MQLTEEQRKVLIDEIDHNRKNCFLSDKTELLMQIAEASLTAKTVAALRLPDEIQRTWDGCKFKYMKDSIRYAPNYANGFNACLAEVKRLNATAPELPDGWRTK